MVENIINRAYQLGYALTSYQECPNCKRNVAKGDLNIINERVIQYPVVNKSIKEFYHFSCYDLSNFKCNFNKYSTIDTITGFNQLIESDQKKIRSFINSLIIKLKSNSNEKQNSKMQQNISNNNKNNYYSGQDSNSNFSKAIHNQTKIQTNLNGFTHGKYQHNEDNNSKQYSGGLTSATEKHLKQQKIAFNFNDIHKDENSNKKYIEQKGDYLDQKIDTYNFNKKNNSKNQQNKSIQNQQISKEKGQKNMVLVESSDEEVFEPKSFSTKNMKKQQDENNKIKNEVQVKNNKISTSQKVQQLLNEKQQQASKQLNDPKIKKKKLNNLEAQKVQIKQKGSYKQWDFDESDDLDFKIQEDHSISRIYDNLMIPEISSRNQDQQQSSISEQRDLNNSEELDCDIFKYEKKTKMAEDKTFQQVYEDIKDSDDIFKNLNQFDNKCNISKQFLNQTDNDQTKNSSKLNKNNSSQDIQSNQINSKSNEYYKSNEISQFEEYKRKDESYQQNQKKQKQPKKQDSFSKYEYNKFNYLKQNSNKMEEEEELEEDIENIKSNKKQDFSQYKSSNGKMILNKNNSRLSTDPPQFLSKLTSDSDDDDDEFEYFNCKDNIKNYNSHIITNNTNNNNNFYNNNNLYSKVNNNQNKQKDQLIQNQQKAQQKQGQIKNTISQNEKLIQSWSKEELIEKLRKNGYKNISNLSQSWLACIVSDGMSRGALPQCLSCNQGQLIYNQIKDEYFCNGIHTSCKQTYAPEQILRKKWIY